MRIKLKYDIERIPDLSVKAGTEGTVTIFGKDKVEARMDSGPTIQWGRIEDFRDWTDKIGD